MNAPLGSMEMILFISSSKPTSNIRSASSITSAFKFRKTNPLLFCGRYQSPIVPLSVKRTWR